MKSLHFFRKPYFRNPYILTAMIASLSACSQPDMQAGNSSSPNTTINNTALPTPTVKTIETTYSPKEAASDSTEPSKKYIAIDVKPPKGAQAYNNKLTPLLAVKTTPERLKRTEAKTKSQFSKPPTTPSKTISLGFSSSLFTPTVGIDKRLITALEQSSDRSFTYGFMYIDEYLHPELEQKISELGLQILNVHGDMYTVKIPRDIRVLRQAITLDAVQWIGYSLPEQKVSTELSKQQELSSKNTLPVFINLFDQAFHKQSAEYLAKAGITLKHFDKTLSAYHADLNPEQIKWLIQQDYVLFVELDGPSTGHHDQSMAVMGVDYIRTGGGGTNFDGSSTIVGIMDSGFMLGNAAATPHVDMNKNGCGSNFTTDAAGVWNDQHDHGTHVMGTIIGAGNGNSENRGVATGVGNSTDRRIRAAKVLNRNNSAPTSSWISNGFDFMANASNCNSPRPQIINASLGTNALGGSGSGSLSRKLDSNTWEHRQLYVISAGNSGSGANTIPSPADAKNALSVGNVQVDGFGTVGDINTGSSRGPTGDGRMKPNVVATGTAIFSVNAGTDDGYRQMTGTSMAAPHVTGIAATVLQHYSGFENRPHLMRAHLMASSILHNDDDTPANNSNGGRNTYGLGRVSSYASHWARSGSEGWAGYRSARTITNNTWGFRDIDIPSGTDRLVVVMTWDEDAASSGANKAVKYDLDLWVDRNADCSPDSRGQCGEWASQSYDDNVEYLIINDPPAGTYRLKIINWDAPSSGLPAAIVAKVIKGDPTPSMSVSTSASTTTPSVNTHFTVNTLVSVDSYIASATHIEITSLSAGLEFIDVSTVRKDGISMNFTVDEFSLGNIIEGDSRSATWRLKATSPGVKSVRFRVWSENGGTETRTVNITAN